ncbi:uncharacterized protein ISCGN_032785 [Ixodes scapularis]
MNAVTWEELKEDVKLKAFWHSQEKAARERAGKRRLTKTLEILIAEENRSKGLFTQDIRDSKGSILELLEKEYRGAMVRSRTLLLESDEKWSKIFKQRNASTLCATRTGSSKPPVPSRGLPGRPATSGNASLVVKGRRCLVIDPGNQDIHPELHWLLYHAPDDKLRIAGGLALVVAPGRVPLCLRCQWTGHIRRGCRVAKCESCHHFGYYADNCVKTYAAAAGSRGGETNTVHVMSEADAKEVAASAATAGKDNEERAKNDTDRLGHAELPKMAETMPVAMAATRHDQMTPRNAAPGREEEEARDVEKMTSSETQQTVDVHMADTGALATKRPRELDSDSDWDAAKFGGDSNTEEPLVKTINHVWAVTFKTPEGKRKALATGNFVVKGRRCLVIDPGNQDIHPELHWLLYHAPDDKVRASLAPCGTVTEVGTKKWWVKCIAGCASMTRTAVMRLKPGLTLYNLPHQLRIAGGLALVVAPGRVPLCLRCQRTGHIRRGCRVAHVRVLPPFRPLR